MCAHIQVNVHYICGYVCPGVYSAQRSLAPCSVLLRQVLSLTRDLAAILVSEHCVLGDIMMSFIGETVDDRGTGESSV